MSAVCAGLAFLFAFLVLTPHAPTTYDQQPAMTAWSSR